MGEDEVILQAAYALLQRNRRSGRLKRDDPWHSFTIPSPSAYPDQFFWDSCFHAIVLSHLDPHQAQEELSSLLAAQEPSGFIPHVIFWNRPRLPYWAHLQSLPALRPRHTAMIQPPVLAVAAEIVYARTGDIAFLRRILPGIKAYYRWLAYHRDIDSDGLIAIISPYESGLDHKPAFDVVFGRQPSRHTSITVACRRLDVINWSFRFNSRRLLRRDYFNVEDVLVNCVYWEGLEALSRLYARVGDDEEAGAFATMANKTENAILTKCYEPEDGLFYDLYRRDERKAKVKTVASLMPVILDNIDKGTLEVLVKRHLLNKMEFWLPYPVPSVARDEGSFNPREAYLLKSPLLWRGPTWVSTNWYIVRGLMKHGYREVAQEIVAKTRELIVKSGFREFYNPFTGEGYGARDFGWSTLIVDMLALMK